MYDFRLDEIIKTALHEDIGGGDITTLSTVSAEKTTTGRFIAKQTGVVCGLFAALRVFELVDSRISVNILTPEGGETKPGDIIARVSGPARGILTGERVALNLLQRLSGIATATARAVKAVSGTKAAITDTRKTTPCFRELEKYAVRTGGGKNHRFNLADGILIKDNHIKAAGGITNAVSLARKNAQHMLKIEVETESFEQIEEALSCGADVIMLDNMGLSDMAAAVALIAGRALVEASGNMGEKDLAAVAQTGVDLISIGALTHSPAAMDISLKLDM